MKAQPTAIADVLLFEPKVHRDERGYFYESFNQRDFRRLTGLDVQFVQDNQTHSRRGVLRGMHYQVEQPQGKLVRVLCGEIFDVSVDLRRSSPNFGRWVGLTLSAENRCQAWVPPGFAHGFLVMSEEAEVLYKASDYYAPAGERCLAWDDATVGITWPLGAAGVHAPVVSARDRSGLPLAHCELYD